LSSTQDNPTCTNTSSWQDCQVKAKSRGVNLFAPGSKVLASTAGASHAELTGPPASAAIAAGAAALVLSRYGQRFNGVFDRWSNLTVRTLLDAAGPTGQLALPAAVYTAGNYTGPLELTPSSTAADSTQIVLPALQYTWYVNNQLVLDPDNRLRVWQKALPATGLPITSWEFVGSSTALDISGQLEVQSPGQYRLYIITEDGFLCYMEGLWLHMTREGGRWAADVTFMQPGG
jgi:hypothetical protein